MPSQSVAPNNCDEGVAEALATLAVAAPSSAKNLIPTVSSAAYSLVEMAVRSLMKTSSTELSRQARMRRGSVVSSPAPVASGLRVVKRVCGAVSGLELTRVLLWKEGRAMVKVSVVGVKVRVVVWEKSVGGAC
jgi:hypothetical protein